MNTSACICSKKVTCSWCVRLQQGKHGLTKEYTLNLTRDPDILEGMFLNNSAVLGPPDTRPQHAELAKHLTSGMCALIVTEVLYMTSNTSNT